MAQIGIYGGSFNPIHIGHISLAEWIVEHTSLDEIWLMVTPNNPLKDLGFLIDQDKRLQWAKTAVTGHDKIVVSDFEFHLPQPSYTIHTLQQLQQAYPQHTFSLVIGTDNLTIFHHWKDWQTILRDFPIYVYPRKGDKIAQLQQTYPAVTILTEAPLYPISSTQIRQELALGHDMRQWVPETIYEEVKETYHQAGIDLLTRYDTLNLV